MNYGAIILFLVAIQSAVAGGSNFLLLDNTDFLLLDGSNFLLFSGG